MYKGTFVAIAEVVGTHLAASTRGPTVERPDALTGALAETMKWERPSEAAQSSRLPTGVGRSLTGPWTLIPTANDRRCAE